MEGHIIPSLHLAHSLKEKGHDIVYLSIADNELLVRKQGFSFLPLFEDIYPIGSNNDKRVMYSDAVTYSKMETHLSKIMEGALDRVFTEINPDLLVMSVFLRMEAILLHYKYKIGPVLLTPYLRQPERTFADECLHSMVNLPGNTTAAIIEFILGLGIHFTSLRELLRPANTFHELILCPQELDMAVPSPRNSVHYTGPSIFQERSLGDKPDLSGIRGAKRIIYASLGSNAVVYGEAGASFFLKMITVMKYEDLADLHLVLSVGSEFDISFLGPAPENVTILRWVSQIDILKTASLMITHGGLGTIKESIYYGVPMIAFPMAYDQPRNAELIAHHSLGKSGQIEEITCDTLRDDILFVLNDPCIAGSIKKMQQLFLEKEASQSDVRVIEQLLAGG
jgi:zeaxanthin glucosyltransferase